MNRQTVLVVDDEAPMRKYVSTNLKARGYDVLTAEDGTEALELIDERAIHLVILDVMIPGSDGLQIIRRLRHDLEVPIVALSARGREADKVGTLDAGADDYLTKPFGIEELLARVRAILRRAVPGPSRVLRPYRSDGLEVDFWARRVRRHAVGLNLTPKEYDVLAYLAHNAGRVLTHRQILQAVWGAEYGQEAEYVWTYVRRIRRKLEPDPEQPRYLLTENGVGYRVPEAEHAPVA